MAATCAVTGNLQDLTGTNNQGYVLFDLINFGDSIPRVIGTTNIVNRKILVKADSSGNISTNLWGNDNISPAGTLYYVTIEDNEKVPIASYTFNITGTNFNLNSATPTPVPTLPSTLPDAIVSVTSSAAGNFAVTHGLGKLPTFAVIAPTSAGFIWFQATKFDSTNLNLVASDASVTADIFVW